MMIPHSLSSDKNQDSPGALPSLANGKASLASPRLSGNANMELDNMDSSEVKLALHDDIMQLARLGEIGPIQKLFEDGKFNAKFEDREGITPLHVGRIETTELDSSMSLTLVNSGLQSTITTRFASSSLNQEPTSMLKEANLLPHLPCGLRRDVIIILSTCFYKTERILFSTMFKATTSFTSPLLMAMFFF